MPAAGDSETQAMLEPGQRIVLCVAGTARKKGGTGCSALRGCAPTVAGRPCQGCRLRSAPADSRSSAAASSTVNVITDAETVSVWDFQGALSGASDSLGCDPWTRKSHIRAVGLTTKARLRVLSYRRPPRASDIVRFVSDWRIVISDTASATDQTALRDALDEFNYKATGYRDGRALSCFLRKDGVLAAGIDGFSWGGYARVEYLWVADRHRGQGLGAQLLAAAEGEARRRGCETIVLDSHSFQAPDFYRRRGYREMGTTTGTPRGFTQTLFQKSL